MKDESLEVIMSYVLIAGVVVSLVVESYGLYLYYITTHGLDVAPAWSLSGRNFFADAINLFASLEGNAANPFAVMAAGIVVLMLTPYIRVLSSVAFYGTEKDAKYSLITILVLMVLTLSLMRS